MIVNDYKKLKIAKPLINRRKEPVSNLHLKHVSSGGFSTSVRKGKKLVGNLHVGL